MKTCFHFCCYLRGHMRRSRGLTAARLATEHLHITIVPSSALYNKQKTWQPPAFPHRRQCSIPGRVRLNHRVRDVDGCFPYPYCHQEYISLCQSKSKTTPTSSILLRKEVIQPHLPIRLPCYDFTPVTGPAFDGSLLAVESPASGVSDSHGVTGGVYKTRERIHRDILIRDY